MSKVSEGTFDGPPFLGTGIFHTLAGRPVKIDSKIPDNEIRMNANTLRELQMIGFKDVTEITGEI